ncbi:MAG: putative Ig domain-containing protein, partial [Pirellulaceae bacterium]|nr:putative Ig domain-containing protein [Pirellulaceae bacterium]
SGQGSRLEFPGVTEIVNGSHVGSDLVIEAFAGGVVDVSAVRQITDPAEGNTYNRDIRVIADGLGSDVLFTALATFADANADVRSQMTARNYGSVTVSPAGTSVQNVEVTLSRLGSLAGSLELQSGSRLGGQGTLYGNVVNRGLVYPGNHLVVQGDYRQSAGGRLEIELRGLLPIVEHDLLTVTGQAQLDGVLDAKTVSFTPVAGDSFRVLEFAAREGLFASYDTHGVTLTPEVSSTDLTLVAGFSSGPAVVRLSANDSAALSEPPFIELAFDEPVDPATLTVDDLTIAGPQGPAVFSAPVAVSPRSDVFRVLLDTDTFASGDYQVTLGPDVRDFAGNRMNQDEDLFNGEAIEDVFTGQVVVALPDFRLESPLLGASEGLLGDPLEVGWTVRNAGQAAAGGDWQDEVWLSADAAWDAGDWLLHAEPVGSDSPLGVQATYERLVFVVPPISADLPAGTYHVLVRADGLQAIYEELETNNVLSLGTVALSFPPLPDLHAAAVTTPVDGQPGQFVTIAWRVSNAGTGPAAGPWVDRVFLSADGNLAGATLLGSSVRSADLAAGDEYTRALSLQLPARGDADYFVILVTDADGAVYEGLDEAANQRAADDRLRLRHADLTPTILTAPSTAVSGDTVTVSWQTANVGTTATLGDWTERIYLSSDAQRSGEDRLLGERRISGPLAAASDVTLEADVVLPLDAEGNLYLLVVTDSLGEIWETGGETNNVAAQAVQIDLLPYADLAVIAVAAPAQVIGDPATVRVDWTVENQGLGPGHTGVWTDAVVLSADAIGGNADDRIVARFEHNGELAAGGRYDRQETITLPAALVGRFHVFVFADADGQVYEHGSEANNRNAAGNLLDVLPRPYADLVVTAIEVPAEALSGSPLDVRWTVANQGIGTTDLGNWKDRVYLARDAQGNDRVGLLGEFEHFGPLGVGDSYRRTGQVGLPHAIAGTYYVVVVTGGPFEFLYTGNNASVSAPVQVIAAPLPDLRVTSVAAPLQGLEGTIIDVAWSVQNIGTGTASGGWHDTVYLQEAGNADAERIALGSYRYSESLAAGDAYSRRETVSLPAQTTGLFRVFVTTDLENTIYEADEGNNAASAAEPLTVGAQPRPNLVVLEILAPASVDAGATLSVEFTVANQGPVPTQTPQWTDAVYLSLDDRISQDDLLLGKLPNQSALAPGESYQSSTPSLVVPKRFRGDVYVLVAIDVDGQVEEWPHEGDNEALRSVFVTPLPLADLVVDQVIAPSQAVQGAEIAVGFTVTNRGPGETDASDWTDTLWLTLDKNRPHPGAGDVLLKTLPHTGALSEDAGYDVSTTVVLPSALAAGTYYLMPWTDPYDVVLEDTLAHLVNQDDPNQIDNNNYRARAIDILGAKPDLAVTAVETAAAILGGGDFSARWTVTNQSNGPALTTGWVDRVYISSHPDPFAAAATAMLVGEVRRDAALGAYESYTATLATPLSPSAAGSYVVVVTDAVGGPENKPYRRVDELDEANNAQAVAVDVTPMTADLLVTDIQVPAVNYSGELLTLRYTVTNVGSHPVWPGTAFWKDFLWISAADTFLRERASFLGEVVYAPPGALPPGASYEVVQQVRLPAGLNGDYQLYIHLDAHNDTTPLFFPMQARILQTGWWPAHAGNNAAWLAEFERWAYEDPTNNLAQRPLSVTYREPDLAVTQLDVPAQLHSGETIAVTMTVTNVGTRDTRQSVWRDGLYLSRDASLDGADLSLGDYRRAGILAAGESYTRSVVVTLPEGIEGTFYILAYADTPVKVDITRTSDIGYGYQGLAFQTQSPLWPWDLASYAERGASRGTVYEFEFEGNNLVPVEAPIQLREPPDLQVTELVIPERIARGQMLDVVYTVTNAGGATPPGEGAWDELIYLSRDPLLDLAADRYVGLVPHSGGLAAGAAQPVATQVPVPTDLLGSYYVFVIADPPRKSPLGRVFEHHHETNNERASSQPLLIELPPPCDLMVQGILAPDAARVGEPVSLEWTVINQSDQAARGRWSDTAYLSADAIWDRSDRPLGRVEFSGELTTGQTYTAHLEANLPPAVPGAYRILVRTDIFNQVYEEVGDANNTTASAETVAVSVDELLLGVPLGMTLDTGQARLYQLTVPAGKTLRVTLQASHPDAAQELFLRYGAAPTSVLYDAAYQGALAAVQQAVVPTTQSGTYFVLVRGHSEPFPDTPLELLAELVPLSIQNVHTDVAGDAKHVSTRIEGAQFDPGAIVKLVRPGLGEYEPVVWEVSDATQILATFDLRGAPHGLYDLKVINPDGAEAVVPYRFLVQRAIEGEVTIGVGGPRAILAGDAGTYSVALQNLGNLDAPYTFFQVGVPELGTNLFVYNLPYLTFSSNVRGGPRDVDEDDVPWARLDSAVNTTGHVLAPGYLFDQWADGFTGFSFNILTYPGLKELYERAFNELRDKIYAAFPWAAEQGLLDDGPQGLDEIYPGLYRLFKALGGIPDMVVQEFIPFQFHLLATATSLTRDEFVTHALDQSQRLREAIISDSDAVPALLTIAADVQAWDQLYLAALEEAGLLQPEGAVPELRENPLITSLMATLASGILYGPAGSAIRSSGDVVEFFEQLRSWYGHDPSLLAPIAGKNPHSNPIAVLPDFAQYDLGLSHPTYFQAFEIYVPWIPFDERGSGLPADFQISGVEPTGDGQFAPLDLSAYLAGGAAVSGLASLVGPFTGETGGFLPAQASLPYTVHFQNDPRAATHASEVRVVTQLDEDLDPRSFRLGDLQIGDIAVHVPAGRALFQGDFDFSLAKGFVLRVSAGIDLARAEATWLLQAIDPVTGEVLRDPERGLLPPNNALGQGAGFVSYTVTAADDVATGAEIAAAARVVFDAAPPEETDRLVQIVDGAAPHTTLAVTPRGGTYEVAWQAEDDPLGSGVRHVTLYVATDGGDYRIWQRQMPDAEGREIFTGEAGHVYQFLALATDRAGNRESPPGGTVAADDGSVTNLGAPPDVGDTTPPNFGIAPEPSPDPSTNPIFAQAELGVPAATPGTLPAEFAVVLQPFQARAFARGIPASHADIGPMALAQAADGSLLVSGGAARSDIYRIPRDGGEAGTPWVRLADPVFNLAFGNDETLWATTGGGPLLELDPLDGHVRQRFGDGVTAGLVVDPVTGRLFVSTARGIEIFDPATDSFSPFSRDENLRVGSLALDGNGVLWATTWPDRRQVVRFNERGRAELVLQFDSDIDSLAFGQPATVLEGLLFVTHNRGPSDPLTGHAAGGRLTMIDLATLRVVTVARDGTRGDVVLTTAEGRVLVSQSHQVDVLATAESPLVVSTNPPAEGLVALPLPGLSVTFDQPMSVGSGAEAGSVVNPDNYVLVGETHGEMLIRGVSWDPAHRTVWLATDWLEPDRYQLEVGRTIESAAGISLAEPYQTSFTAVSDYSAALDIEFGASRWDRGAGTVSFEVQVTNIGAVDVRLPLVLVLDPQAGYPGIPRDASGQTVDGRWLIDLSGDVSGGVRLAPGESTAGRTLVVENPDARRVAFEAGVAALPTVNEPPIFDSGPLSEAAAGTLYTYQALARDPDGAGVSYLLIAGPEGMTVAADTGQLLWLPTSAHAAENAVILHAYDRRGGRAVQEFSVNVAGGNRAPLVGDIPASRTVAEGVPLTLPLSVSDPDGDTLVYWASDLPPGAVFYPQSGILSWTPGGDSAGTYKGVTLCASDGVNTVRAVVEILVLSTDQPPTLADLADRTVREGDQVRFYLSAQDRDGDPLAFRATGLPPGAELDPISGRFEWVPAFHQVGEYEVTFHVAAAGAEASQTARFTVLNANGAPVFDPLAGWRVFEGQTLAFRAFAFDPDNPGYVPQDRLPDGTLTAPAGTQATVTYAAEGLPPGATLDPVTAAFHWTPAFDQAGQYAVSITATDDGDGTGTPLATSLTLALSVLNLNRSPELAPVDNLTIDRGVQRDVEIAASDPDGNPVQLALGGLPGYPLPRFATFTDRGDGTGQLQLAPGPGDRGVYSLQVAATDDGDGGGPMAVRTASWFFNVTVVSANEPPTWDFIGDQVAVIGEQATWRVRARDLDLEPLQFQLAGLPAGATLSLGAEYGTAVVSWTPAANESGSYAASLTVSDGGNGNPDAIETAAAPFQVVVRASNAAPTLDPVGDQAANEGCPLALTLTAHDGDEDVLTYTASGLPEGAVLDPQTGVIA